METVKALHPFSRRAALVTTALLIGPLVTSEVRGNSSIAVTETNRRAAAVSEAQELLRKGDESYIAGNYRDATEAYAGAREMIPDAPISAELRAAATQRFAQASVEYGRELSRKGDVAGAKAVVDRVLAPGVAPDDAATRTFRAQLDDPIRTNPALTKEHAANVDQVRRLLYTADGAYNLGNYDLATSKFNEVLRIDPTNTAARRGMEKVAGAKSNYGKAAFDHTRAEMLAQVDSQWEIQPIDPEFDAGSMIAGGAPGLESEQVTVRNKLDRIIIPRIDLDDATLNEALDLIRIRAQENDPFDRQGVNITVNLGPPDSPEAQAARNHRFNLHLANLPLSGILKYVTEITKTVYSTDDYAVLIRLPGSASSDLITRTYKIPANFRNAMGATSKSAANDDPFAAPASNSGLLAQKVSIQEALAQQGVQFPEGASATEVGNTLRVVNSAVNQEFITQIVDNATRTEPVTVWITVTMIKTQQQNLTELGFDWLLDNFGFGGSSWIPGQSKLNLGGGTTGNGTPIDDVALGPQQHTANPITAGNRSGDAATSADSIDNLINNQQGRQVANNRAPGIINGRLEISNATVNMLMRGLDQKKGTDLLARPSVVTRSGQSATVASVREMIYATEYEPPELPNSVGDIQGGMSPVTPAHPTAFSKKDIGLTLEVTPVVDPSKRFINVTLQPVFTDFDGFVNYGSPINTTQQGLFGSEVVPVTDNSILMPIYSVNKAKTEVDVVDGGTVAFASLLQESVETVDDKTPVLGSIPIIGRLFQSRVRKPTSTAVIFLVKVDLTDPTGRKFNPH